MELLLLLSNLLCDTQFSQILEHVSLWLLEDVPFVEMDTPERMHGSITSINARLLV